MMPRDCTVAASTDGRRIVFEAPLGTALTPGGFAVVATEPPVLAQVTGCEIGVRTQGGRRHNVLEGTAIALRESVGGFGDRPIAPASPEAIAAWARESLGDDGLELGALVHAPELDARCDARGLARHTFLCGQSGSGKTYTTGVLLEQVVRRTGLRLVVLDPNSDHVGIREVRDGTEPELGARHRERASPIQVARGDSGLAFATTGIGMRLSNFTPAAQRLALRLDAVDDSDEVEALLDATARATLPYSPADIAELASATGGEAGRRLAVRIRALGIDRWKLWAADDAQPALGDLVAGGTGLVVDTGSVDDPAERSAVAAGVLASVWARRAERVPTLVVLDEAHHICPAVPTDPIQAVATEHAVLIAGEGRKYGIFLLVATQRPQKVHPSVVAGCEGLVLLRMNSQRDVDELAAMFSHVPEGLLRLAPGFARGEALIAGPLVPAPLHIRVGARLTPEGGSDVPTTWATLPL